jgi:hypothetical protein
MLLMRSAANAARESCDYPSTTALPCAGIKGSLITIGELQVVTMDSVEAYRQSASRCLALSRKAGDPADRELLVAMAQRWLQLAERADTSTGELGEKGNVSDAATTDRLAEAR